MSSTVVATVVKMLESLPEAAQDQVAEHLRGYIADLQDERQWDRAFKKTRSQLVSAPPPAKKKKIPGEGKTLGYWGLWKKITSSPFFGG